MPRPRSRSEGPRRAGERLSGDEVSARPHFHRPGRLQHPLTDWLAIANRRIHRSRGTRPAERWEADRAGTLALPPVDPPRWFRFHTRIGRDHYIRVDTCDYSVHPLAIGKRVHVATSTSEVVLAPARAARAWLALHWNRWRRRHQTQARISHYRQQDHSP
ncbi:hypothetical protein [Streptomyces sp. OV198]|uniref:Mu transposase domain-containing protein n=1 Tax=Streptomyces sp. OV198 TaxID=1882787 RepID=UPI00359CB82A